MARPKKQDERGDVEMVPIGEGMAQILIPKSATNQLNPTDESHQKQTVFYNPIQQFNRDLSVLAIKAFGDDLVYCRKALHEANTRSTKKQAKYVGRNWKAAQKKAEAAKRAAEENGAHVEQSQSPSKRQKTEEGNYFEAGAEQPAPEFVGDFAQDVTQNGQFDQSSILQFNQQKLQEQVPNQERVSLDANQHPPGAEQVLPLGVDDSSFQQSNQNIDFPSDQTQGQSQATELPELEAAPVDTWSPRFTILDALSATGLRALRYAHEIPAASAITACDLSPSATAQIAANVSYNNLDSKIRVITGNAQAHMYSMCSTPPSNSSHNIKQDGPTKYDVIDLDPYGTAAPFLDAALQGISDGGLLAVTCTDAGVWASNGYLEKCFALYGGTPLRGLHSHEGGLRLILQAIATSGARYGISIEPLLSLSIDFYARVFVRVRKSPAEVKFLAGRTISVYQCDSGCGAWITQPLARHEPYRAKDGAQLHKFSFAQAPVASPHCEHCGSKTHLAGPMWGGPLHNTSYIQHILRLVAEADKSVYATKDRIEGMLTTALEEITLNDPEMSKSLKQASTVPANNPGDVPPTTPLDLVTIDKSPSTHAPEAGQHPNQRQDEPKESFPPKQDQNQNQNQNQKQTKQQQLDSHRPIPPNSATDLDQSTFYFSPSMLSKILHCRAPSDVPIKGALRHLGYGASRTHTKPGNIKTTAPWAVIWKVMREWVAQRAPIKEGALRIGSPGWRILYPSSESSASPSSIPSGAVNASNGLGEGEQQAQVQVQVQGQAAPETPLQRKNREEKARIENLVVVFDDVLGKQAETKGMVRYQVNPRAHWGPIGRAKAR